MLDDPGGFSSLNIFHVYIDAAVTKVNIGFHPSCFSMAVATQREQWDASRVNGFIPHISSSSSFFYAYTTPCAFSNDIRHIRFFLHTKGKSRENAEKSYYKSIFLLYVVLLF